MGRQRVAILGIDVFARKNLYQARAVRARGYELDVLSTSGPEARGDVEQAMSVAGEAGVRFFRLAPSPLGRLAQVARYLLAHRSELHHVEVYVGTRYACAYAALAGLVRVPTLAVERGDIRHLARPLESARQDRLTWASMRWTYSHVDCVWYKEPYMRPLLQAASARRLEFLPNCLTGVPAAAPLAWEQRDLDFVYANRVIEGRHPEWLLEALLSLPRGASTEVRILGLTAADDTGAARGRKRRLEELASQLPRVELHAYRDPMPFFEHARFFAFPARMVFGNHALLEAMAHGVVPIVTRSEGVEAVVRHGQNGWVTGFGADEYREGVAWALELGREEWERLSEAARETVRSEFGEEAWGDRLEEMYRRLEPGPSPEAARPALR